MRFKTQPYQHQLTFWEKSRDKDAWALFLDKGTGKTKLAIDTIAWLWLKKKIDGAIIVAPKGFYLTWYDEEIPKHMPDEVEYTQAYWSSSPKKIELENLRHFCDDPSKLHLFIANVEAFSGKKDSKIIAGTKWFLSHHKSTIIIIDESTCIRDSSSNRTKTLIELGRRAKYKRILTGQPIPNNPLQIYAQAEFLKKGLLGFSSFYAFRNRFAVMIEMRAGAPVPDEEEKGKKKFRTFKKVVGYQNKNELKKLIDSFSFCIKKEDCLDLPEKVYSTRIVQMAADQQKAYDDMVERSVALLEDQETVTAPMVMTQLMKLHQIACGFVKTDDSIIHRFKSNPKLESLSEMIDDLDESEKIVVWATYVESIETITAHFKKKLGDKAVVTYYGGTEKEEKRQAQSLIQDPDSGVRMLIGNPQTGKFGLTLTRAKHTAYFSNSYDFEDRDQSEDRTHRIGQDSATFFTDLVARGTVDDRVLQVLRGKRKVTSEIIVSHWRWMMGAE